MNAEEWKDIEGYNGRYQVSSLGNVRATEFEYDYYSNQWHKIIHRVQKAHNMKISGNVYKFVSLSGDDGYHMHYIHRLVASAFLLNPLNLPEVDHLDSDPSNNAVTNLEWVTSSENSRRMHANHPGLCKGRHLSDETKAKISASRKGVKHTNHNHDQRSIDIHCLNDANVKYAVMCMNDNNLFMSPGTAGRFYRIDPATVKRSVDTGNPIRRSPHLKFSRIDKKEAFSKLYGMDL